MKNFKQAGKTFNHAVTSGEASIASGEVVVEGKLIGIANTDGTYTSSTVYDTIAVNLEGVYLLDKTTSLVITKGDNLYYNTTTKKITKTNTDVFIGVAWTSELSAATTVEVLLRSDANGAAGQAAVQAFSAGSNLVGVDGTGSNAAPLAGTETRLDALETAMLGMIAKLQAAGLMGT